MDANRLLICLGDPIIDIYTFGELGDNFFKTERTIRNYGGALNVYNNALSILRESDTLHACWVNPLRSHLPIILKVMINFYTVTRYINSDDELLLEASITPQELKSKFYSRKLGPIATRINVIIDAFKDLVEVEKTGLILSEYNKGAFNNNADINIDSLPDFDFCVVDSRYRTVNLDLLRTSSIKIWHATNTEYDPSYARNFHYTLHTNAEEPVRILDSDGNVICNGDPRLLVPNTKIVNTCGAGDTFTAAVAAYLLKQDKINIETLTRASEFAIKCCQEVIQTRCTTQTTVRLE